MRDDKQQDARTEAAGDEPRVEDLGRRSFAGENMAADQRDQARERFPGFDGDISPDRNVDTTGLPRDGNGDPLGGMTPEDDLD